MDSTSTINRCTAITKAGTRCQNPALGEDAFCWWHSPATAEQRKEARSRGGRARHNRSLGDLSNGERVTIDSLADVMTVLGGELGEVLQLERSISRARAVGYLCGILANIYQASELEQRIAALEQRAGKGRK